MMHQIVPLMAVPILMSTLIFTNPVWFWINNDEEEDTVRFRQRLMWAVFWFVSFGVFRVSHYMLNKRPRFKYD